MITRDRTRTIDFLTDFSCQTADALVATWRTFYGYLFCKFMDGNIKKPVPGKKNPEVQQPPLPDWYLRLIVGQTGEKLKVHEK